MAWKETAWGSIKLIEEHGKDKTRAIRYRYQFGASKIECIILRISNKDVLSMDSTQLHKLINV